MTPQSFLRCISLTALLAGVFVSGCKNKESMVAGTWTAPGGLTFTANADKTFTGMMGKTAMAGKWHMDGDDVVVTPETIAGQPVAQAKAQAEQFLTKMPPSMQKAAKDEIDSIDRPNVMKLADDGKTMTTDKPKDTNPGPAITFTKS